MKDALIFPGQGSQKVGMGKELAKTYRVSKEVFEIVDEALGQNLSKLIWEGDLNELTLTENTQPALMANSIAVLAALESEGVQMSRFKYVAGHSLGEYTALCAAKSIKISDAAKLLRIRGKAMQDCDKDNSGAMAAILGLSFEKIQEIVENVTDATACQVANDNDPAQVVISGHKEAVNKAIDLAKKTGAKRALQLNVSAPFHSYMMAPATHEMRSALSSIRITKPLVPIVMNVLAKDVTKPDLIRQFLIDQVANMVRWRESIMFMTQKGVQRFFELGEGKALSGMVRRTSTTVQTINISSPEDIRIVIDNYGEN